MKKPRRLLIRRWLNQRGWDSHGHVLFEITPRDDGQRKASVTFDIADCTRIVGLNFDLYDTDTRTNALYKAHELRKAVNQFVDRLEETVEWIEEAEDD